MCQDIIALRLGCINEDIVNEGSSTTLPPHARNTWGIRKHENKECYRVRVVLILMSEFSSFAINRPQYTSLIH